MTQYDPKWKFPNVYDFPDVLTLRAQDSDGNLRDVHYYRADAYINLFGRVEDVMRLDFKKPDWGKGDADAEPEEN